MSTILLLPYETIVIYQLLNEKYFMSLKKLKTFILIHMGTGTDIARNYQW